MKPMQRRNAWSAYHDPRRRLRLFTPPTIIGLGAAASFSLFLAYGHHHLEDKLAAMSESGRTDPLTVEYLKVLLKADPSASALRLSLAAQLARLGQLAEARAALTPLSDQPVQRLKVDAAWLMLSILEQEAFQEPPGSAGRAEGMQKMRNQLARLLQMPLDTEAALLLAQKAMAAGDPVLALDAYRQIVRQSATSQAAVYAEAATAVLGLGDYRTSAALYFISMHRSNGLLRRREYFLDGLRTLQAGRYLDDAIAAADRYLGPLGDDRTTLLFLIRLAQAANRAPDAERYAKQLLKMVMLRTDDRHELTVGAFQTPMDYVIAQWQSKAAAPRLIRAAMQRPDDGPGIPFDDEAYRLSYEVFLQNRNLAAARRVAQSAVDQQPGAAAWHKRMAEVSEWSGAPEVALGHWGAYAKLTNDEAAWDAVLRLAVALSDQPAQRAVLEHKLARYPRQDEWLEQLLALMENAGDAEGAMDLLESRLTARTAVTPANRRKWLERYAALADRSGNDAALLQTLRTLQRESGPDGWVAHRIAEHHLRQGDVAAAFAALHSAVTVVASSEDRFWRTYAELAGLLQEDGAAEEAYRKLIASDKHDVATIENMVALLDRERPHAAARLAEFGYSKFGEPLLMQQALALFIRIADWYSARRLLTGLPAPIRGKLEQDSGFLAARAMVWQASNRLDLARTDLEAAIRLRPQDGGLRASLVWTLIAQRDTTALKQLLRAWSRDAQGMPALWSPFAAAHMSVNQQDVALYWFRKSGTASRDYLWAMSYAECLEANYQPELAWEIRRKVWMDLRKPGALQTIDAAQWRDLQGRLASIAPLFVQGDQAQRIIQAVLQSDVSIITASPAPMDASLMGGKLLAQLDQTAEATPQPNDSDPSGTAFSVFSAKGESRPDHNRQLSAAARELALAYALGNGADDLARAWLASRFADQLASPAWAELSLALGSRDHVRLTQLLDTMQETLPMYDRVTAAQAIGRPALAQTLAFEQLDRLPNDEQLHLQLSGLSLEEPRGLDVQVTQSRQSSLDVRRQSVQAAIPLSGGVTLQMGGASGRLSNGSLSELGPVTAQDNEVALSVRRKTGTGYVSVGLQQRHAVTTTTGLRLDYQLAPAPSILISGFAGLRQRTSESPLLRAGGMRSGLEANLSYAVTSRESLSIGMGWHAYATQGGTRLGSGYSISMEAGSQLRIAYPNLRIRAYASRAAFSSTGRSDEGIVALAPAGIDPSTFRTMPENSTNLGLGLGIGTVAENRYSRAWRPFTDFALNYNPVAGTSLNIRGGISGSVLGSDLLTLRAQRLGDSPNRPDGTRELDLLYKLYF